MDSRVSGKHWSDVTGNNINRAGYGHFIRSKDAFDIYTRAVLVVQGAGGGCFTGMAIGATAGGAGAIPGAIVGSIVGAVATGVALCNEDYSEYTAFRKKINHQARAELDEIMYAKGKINEDDACSITGNIPAHPVRIRGERQVYEREDLKKWIKDKGTSPHSRVAVTQQDIIDDPVSVAKTGKLCDSILNNDEERAQLTAVQLVGIALLRNECLQKAEKHYDRGIAQLNADNKRKRLSPLQFAARAAELAAIYDPVIGEEAEKSRVEVDSDSIELPLEVFIPPAEERKQ